MSKKLPKNFCPIPFTSMILDPFGNVLSCREQGKGHILGNVKEQHWSEIWNNEKYRAWRREFLEENIVTCKEHQRDRNCHNISWNRNLIEYVELSEVISSPPKRLSPDFNGRCNLQCEMCSIWSDPNGLYDELGFWEDATESLFPYLKQIDPLHGEPMIQKDTFRLMDITAEVSPECEYRITTNGHYKFNQAVKDRLDKIKLWNINISLDTTHPEHYAKIRKGGDVNVVLKNIDDTLAYRKERVAKGEDNFLVTVNTTIYQENMWDLPDFVKYVRSLDDANLLVQFLYEPSQLSCLAMDEQERLRLLDFYFKEIPSEDRKSCQRVLTPLVESITDEVIRKKLTLFI
jgi:radical SAM protein with 4Fe4S-binding SPASM domain